MTSMSKGLDKQISKQTKPDPVQYFDENKRTRKMKFMMREVPGRD